MRSQIELRKKLRTRKETELTEARKRLDQMSSELTAIDQVRSKMEKEFGTEES